MIAGRLIEKTEEEPGVIVVNPTVSWNPSAQPLEITLKDWNRGFELGSLKEWAAVAAEISTVEPYEGRYCCRLINTGSKITQTLGDPAPVSGVWMFMCRARSRSGVNALEVHMLHTDGSSAEIGWTVRPDGWTDVFFERSQMNTSKILSGIEFESVAGEIFIDGVFLGLATELTTGSVETLQVTPGNLQAEVIARPKGDVLVKASADTTDDWLVVGEGTDEVAEYVPIKDWKFELAKILVSCPKDVMYRLRWNEKVISAEVYVAGGIPFTDWFPWDYEHMRGDGSKAFDIQVKYPAGGEAAECHAEIVGETVKWAFNL